MLKHTLLVVLAVALFGITGCPELKTLRQQNATLKTQLAQVTQAKDDAESQLAAVTAQRDEFQGHWDHGPAGIHPHGHCHSAAQGRAGQD